MAVQMPGPVVKIHKRLLPLFVSLVVVCYLDRTSLAFAALQLCQEPWFDARVYGLGSGVFYAGYVLFQVPSNLILSRLGARTWLPLITAAWGLVATCCIFIKGPASFYALRLALGVTESGAFPAMWHICGQFYPSSSITLAYSVIEASIAISQIIAAPVAAGLLQLSGVWGLAGWQHLFLFEGLATLVLAGILRWRLPGSVLTADFLTSEDKLWLLQQLQPSTVDVDAVVTAGTSTTDPEQQQLAQPGLGMQGMDGQLQGMNSAVQGMNEGGIEAPKVPAAGSLRVRTSSNPSLAALQQPSSKDELSRHGLQPQQQQQQLGAVVKETALPAVQQLLLTFRNKLIWYLMLLKALKDIALDGLVYWVPLLIHALIDGSMSVQLHTTGSSSSSGSGDDKHCGGKDSQLRAVLLTAIPFGTAAVAALTLGHSSEVSGERHKHIGLPLLLGGVIFALLPLLLGLQSHVPAFLAVTAAVVAADATTGPFWTWVHMAAAPGTEAVSLAAVNSIGKAGGFLGPLSFGLILHATGSYVPSILLVSAVLVIGGVLALAYRGEHAHARYSQLQQDKAVLRSRSGFDDSAADGAQQQQQHKPRRQQRQQWQQQEQQPELELLRGSSGDSQYSSQYSSYRPSAEG